MVFWGVSCFRYAGCCAWGSNQLNTFMIMGKQQKCTHMPMDICDGA